MRIERELRTLPVEVDVLAGGPQILERIAAEWRTLCDEGPCDEPFYRPEWISAHLRAFEPDASLRVYTARSGGRLRAVLPLVEERATVRGIPVRKLRSAAGVHSCRFDLVHGRDDGMEMGRRIWERLRASGGWDVIEITDVPEGGVIDRLLGVAEEDGHPIGRWESLRTPYIPIDGTFDQVLERTDAKFRANVRRRRKKLEGKGAVRFVHTKEADARVLADFYELERSGWKGERGTAIGCDPKTRRFYDQIATWASEQGCLSLYALELEGRPVAMHYGLTWRGRYFLPKPAFDEGHRECSPGQLLLHDVLRSCAEQGLREFDFLGPWMEWKADWTDQVRVHHWCYVFRKGPVGQALHAAKFRLKALTTMLRGK